MVDLKQMEVLRVDISAMQLAPTDILVIKVHQPLTADVHHRLKGMMERFRGDGGKVLVMDSLSDVSIIKATDA